MAPRSDAAWSARSTAWSVPGGARGRAWTCCVTMLPLRSLGRAPACLAALTLVCGLARSAAAAEPSATATATSPTAATVEPARRGPPPLRPRRWSIHAGYFGDFLLHPGAFAGAGVRLVGVPRAELVVQGTLATWVHRRNSIGLAAYPELMGRVHLGRRVALEGTVGVGLLHSWLAAPVFALDDAGVLHRAPNRGRNAVMPTGSFGVAIETRHVAPFVRLAGFGQYPFNHHMLAHFALMLGVRL